MLEHGEIFVLSLVMGFLARAFMLRIDYRQFPSYPHSYIIHLTMGLIASALGALALPALMAEEFIAVTFLTLAAQQFRDVRNLERDSLDRIEESELIPKGSAYVEGIAKLFEARNYLALLTSLGTSLVYFYSNLYLGILAGILIALFLHRLMKGEKVADIARVEIVPLKIQGHNVGIGENIIMNVGEVEALEKWRKEGIGIIIIPRDEDARATLFNLGQRQAILHDLSILMGVKLDQGLQQYTPLARLEINRGTLNVIIIPQEPDKSFIQEAINKIPVLESTRRKPLLSTAGNKAAD